MDLAELQNLGQVFTKSGFFADTRDAAQAVVKVMAGMELGFPPIASMTGVYIVKGKVSLSANLMAAAIKKSGKYNYRVRQLDEKGCKIEFFENGESVGFSEFTKADASNAGLAGETWKKFFRNMAFARAMSNGAKWYCADIFGGPIYTPEELGAQVDGETGEVVGPVIEPALEPCEHAFGVPGDRCENCGERVPEGHMGRTLLEAEPEPVRPVKLEGAQPTEAQWALPEGLQGPAGHVIKLANTLRWNEPTLAQCIEANFGVIVEPGQLKGYLEFASKDELRELYRIMNSQGGKR